MMLIPYFENFNFWHHKFWSGRVTENGPVDSSSTDAAVAVANSNSGDAPGARLSDSTIAAKGLRRSLATATV